MSSCESCQKQLFAHLYDLLEPQERQEVEEHLRDCAHCQAELERTRIQRAELAAAVKGSFPDIVFKTPRATARPFKPATAPRRPRQPLLLNRWAMAAAVLFMVLSAGTVIAVTISHYQGVEIANTEARLREASANLQKVRAEADRTQGEARKEIRAINDEIDRMLAEWNEKDLQRDKAARQQRVRFDIKTPRSIQAGAPNTLTVQARPANAERPVKVTHLRAQVVNEETNTVLFDKQLATTGENKLVLPPDLEVKPGDELALIVRADTDGPPETVRERLPLLFPEYVTHLSTDRPMYRPGETVRFRSLTLERFSLQPAPEDLNLRYRIVGPNNREVFKRDVSTRLVAEQDKKPITGPDGQPLHGVGAGEFTVPNDLPGGVYVLSVAEQNERFAEEKRTFVVHRWQAPRFSKQAEFNRSSYGPGDRVSLRGKVTRLGDPGGIMGAGGPAGGGAMMPGAPMAGGPGGPGILAGGGILVHATVIVDGQSVQVNNERQDQNVELDGSFTVEFNLPGVITQGSGTVSLAFDDGGNVETLVKSIPIVLRDVAVEFFPEGGDLILGVPSRVYFQARTGTSKPADVQGRILERAVVVNKDGKEVVDKNVKNAREVARVQTLSDDREPGINQGMGSFTFVPQAGRRYELRLDAPAGNTKAYVLPRAKADGVVLHLPRGVVDTDIPVTLRSTGRDRELLVGAYCRGRMLDHTPVLARAGQQTDIVLHPHGNAGGVYRVTVFEKQAGDARYVPVAERLLFRMQTAQLHVTVQPDRDVYAPGEHAGLSLLAHNEKNQLSSAVAMVAVIDSSTARLANDRSARMPAHFLLTTEIRHPEDLENADALLGAHPRAAEALDLLLGVQGWRRFAEQDPQKFFAAKKIDRKPVGFLASAQQVARVGVDQQQTRDEVDLAFIGRFNALESELAQKEREEAGPPEVRQQLVSAQNSLNMVDEVRKEQVRRRDDLWRFFLNGGFGLAGFMFILFAFFLVSAGLHRLAEGKHGYVFLGCGIALLGMLFMVSVLGTFALMGVPQERFAFFNNNRMGFKMAPPMAATVVQQAEMAMEPGGGVPAEWMALEENAELRRRLEEENQPAAPPQPGFPAPGVPRFPMPGAGNQNMGQMLPDAEQFRNPDADRLLRQQGRYDEILRKKLGRKVTVPPPAEASVVREYAHQHKEAIGNARRDWTETLYWQPALVLQDGQAQVQFDLSDAVTHFRVVVVSHTLDGRLGADSMEIASRLPYSIEPKVPTEIAKSDQLIVPVAVANNSSEKTGASIKVQATGLELVGEPPASLRIEPGQTKRQLFRFQPALMEGKADLRFKAKFDKGTDIVERSFIIAPDGFPAGQSFGGTLKGNEMVAHEIVMPDNWIAGSLSLQVQGYPSVLADLQRGLDGLLREPTGCFEQSSSSNYPNVLILNYLQDSKQASPAVEKQARRLLTTGYEKLLSFECTPPDDPNVRRGYEWFGQTAPPHEALTAYGLLQFHDMARVFPVDQAMVQRTQKYLLDQRDRQGGFKRNERAVDRFGRAPQDITNAYIVWALTETGVRDDLAVELDALYEQGKASRDPYFIALAALSEINAARKENGQELLGRLRDFQRPTGEVAGARTSITSSAGRDLLIETTALSMLGWVRGGRPVEFNAAAQKAGRWLVQQRGGTGSFGSTQSTILALKALIAVTGENQKVQPGELRMEVMHDNVMGANGQARYNPGGIDPINVLLKEKTEPGTVPVLLPGKNLIQVHYDGNAAQLPYTVSCSYRTEKPSGSDECPLRLTAGLDRVQAREGETIKLKAVLHNRSGHDQGMAVALLGLPAGLALPDDFQQLKDLARLREDGTSPGVISAWELRGRELVLYWRDLQKDARIDLNLDLVCRLPGTYTGPASRAYLYYNADHKHWIDPLRVSIDAVQ
jgi:anti-sigma factor RsiW